MTVRIPDFMKPVGMSAVAVSLLMAACLTVPAFVLAGCGGAPSGDSTESQEPETLKMQVTEISQLTKLGDKTADGQYIVAQLGMKNIGKETITMNSADFVLENITDKEEERYSQPAEEGIGIAFAKTFGDALKDKVFDGILTTVKLYPKLQAERYFVFMVPADAKPDQYQITYTPLKVSTPLASKNTTVNDHRNDNPYAPQ